MTQPANKPPDPRSIYPEPTLAPTHVGSPQSFDPEAAAKQAIYAHDATRSVADKNVNVQNIGWLVIGLAVFGGFISIGQTLFFGSNPGKLNLVVLGTLLSNGLTVLAGIVLLTTKNPSVAKTIIGIGAVLSGLSALSSLLSLNVFGALISGYIAKKLYEVYTEL